MKKHYITMQDTGQVFDCKEDEVIHAAICRSRVGAVQYGCFGGGCGVCRMRVVSGDFEVVKRMSRAHVPENRVDIALMCCIQPRGDMVIASQEQDPSPQIKDNIQKETQSTEVKK